MVSSGLVQKFFLDHINPKGRNEKEDQIGPQVLTMDDLEVAFLICGMPLALSLAVFIGELSIFWLKRFLMALKGRVIAAAIVTAFYDQKINNQMKV